MAGNVTGGQVLTPNNNVFAPAGMGGDLWGANGGGITPVGGGATDQTGYVKPIAATASDGDTATNYLPGTPRPVLALENSAALSGQTQDSTLASGGSNAG